MKKESRWIVCAVLSMGLIGGCGKIKKSVPLADVLKGSVVDAHGSTVDASPLLETDYLLLYFSAHWCQPCKVFTPRLVDFYNTQGGGKLFQVALVSSDRSEKKMLSYMQETRMPWSAVRFGSAAVKTLKETYGGAGIPCLVLIDSQGAVIADSYAGKKYLGPQHVLEYLKKRLAKIEVSSPVKPQAPSVKPSAPSPKKQTVNKSRLKKFKLSGFGGKGDKRMAIINGKIVTVGSKLDQDVIVKKISESFVEISVKGDLHRLYVERNSSK